MIPAVATLENDTLSGMGKKKPSGGEHKPGRRNIGINAEWHAVIRRLAAARKQPILYVILDLVAADAKKHGIEDLPELPWETGEGEPE